MKRLALAVVVLAAAVAAYIFVYPRFSGNKPSADSTATTTPGGNGGGSRAGGGVTAVRTAVATKRDVPLTRAAVGMIEAIDTVNVKPQADGVVTERDVADGQVVKAGMVMFKLDDRAIQATIAKDKAALEKDQANLVSASADLNRVRSLRNNQVSTQQQLDQAVAAASSLQASVAMDQAQLQADEVQLNYLTISAPIDGRVGVVNTSVGNLVRTSDTGNGLLTITRTNPVRVSFTVAERDLDVFRSALAGGGPVPVQVIASGSAKQLGVGRLNFIDSTIDQASGTVLIKAELPNDDAAMWPGQYVNVSAEVGLMKDAVTVPTAAVQQDNQGPFVYIVKPDQTVAKQAVALAEPTGELSVITSGIAAGNHVVIDGQLRLKDGSHIRETVVPDKAASTPPDQPAGATQKTSDRSTAKAPDQLAEAAK